MYIPGGIFVGALIWMAIHEKEIGYLKLLGIFMAACVAAMLLHAVVVV